MTQKLSEKEYQAHIVAAAQTLGWTIYHTYNSRRSTRGFPDLVLVRPPRVIFAEVKTLKGEVTPVQGYWRDDLEACPGVEYYLWRPKDWDSVVDALRP